MFDPTTLAAYIAANSPTAKAEAVRDSLGSGTLHAVIYDGGVEQYSGSFAGPLTASGGVLSADSKLTGLYPDAAVPDSSTWTLRIENADGTRWVEGTFGGGGRFQVSRTLAKGQSLRLEVSIASPGVVTTGSFAVTESGDTLSIQSAPGDVPLSVSGVPDVIVIEQGGSYDFAPRITGGTPDYYVAVTGGTLPDGVTWASNTALQAASGATIATSGDITFTIADSAEQPADLTIASFTVASVTYYSVGLQWTAAPDATIYTVEKRADSVWIHAQTTTALTYTDLSVAESSTYQYRVRASDGTNTGAWVTVSATTTAQPVVEGAEDDWQARATGPGVIFAHDFREDDEFYTFERGSTAPYENVITGPHTNGSDSRVDIYPAYLVPTQFGNSKATRSEAYGTYFTQPVASAPAGTIQTLHCADVFYFKDPAIVGYYNLIIGVASGVVSGYSGGTEYVEVQGIDYVNNTLTVRRRSRSAGPTTPPAYPADANLATIGYSPQTRWNRPLVALPAGQNGKSTDDIGISRVTGDTTSNTGPRKARSWNKNSTSGHADFREGFYCHPDYHPGGANSQDTYNTVDGRVITEAYEGHEFYLQWRVKVNAGHIAASQLGNKMFFMQTTHTSNLGQIFWLGGSQDENRTTPIDWPHGDSGRFLQPLFGYGDSRQLFGGVLGWEGQTNSGGTQNFQYQNPTEYPDAYLNSSTHPIMRGWCFPADKWVTFLFHLKPGRDSITKTGAISTIAQSLEAIDYLDKSEVTISLDSVADFPDPSPVYNVHMWRARPDPAVPDLNESMEVRSVDRVNNTLTVTRNRGRVGAITNFSWSFSSSVNGWGASNNASVALEGTYLRVTATGANPSIKRTADGTFVGSVVRGFTVRFIRVSGTGWAGKLRWKNANHGFSASYEIAVADPGAGDQTIRFEITPDNPGYNDWISGNYQNIEIQLGADSGDVFDIRTINRLDFIGWDSGTEIAFGPAKFTGLPGYKIPTGMGSDSRLGYRETTFKVYAHIEGESGYTLVSGGDNIAWLWGQTYASWEDGGDFYPPGLQNIDLGQNLNDYVGSGAQRVSVGLQNCEYTQVILSKQFIPAPQV